MARVCKDKDGNALDMVTILLKLLDVFKTAAQRVEHLVRDNDSAASYERTTRVLKEEGGCVRHSRIAPTRRRTVSFGVRLVARLVLVVLVLALLAQLRLGLGDLVKADLSSCLTGRDFLEGFTQVVQHSQRRGSSATPRQYDKALLAGCELDGCLRSIRFNLPDGPEKKTE